MSLHILNFNFQLCSVPEVYTSPTEHKAFKHTRTCSTLHKTNKRENVLKYYLLASGEAVF